MKIITTKVSAISIIVKIVCLVFFQVEGKGRQKILSLDRSKLEKPLKMMRQLNSFIELVRCDCLETTKHQCQKRIKEKKESKKTSQLEGTTKLNILSAEFVKDILVITTV